MASSRVNPDQYPLDPSRTTSGRAQPRDGTTSSAEPGAAPWDGTGSPTAHGTDARDAATTVPAEADAAVPRSVHPAGGGAAATVRHLGVLEEARRLASLKWRVLRNTLSRSTWVLVGTILGGLYALGVLAMLMISLYFLGAEELRWVVTASVLLGTALLLGWWILPVATSKADATLDPARLGLFPLSTSGLLVGQVLGALIGIPGALTLVAGLGWAVAWRSSLPAVLVSIPCALLGLLLAFVGSRCVSAVSLRLAGGRRTTETVSIVALALAVLTGPIITALGAGLERVWGLLPTWAAVLAWTPLGAVWAVPGDIALGHWGAALARLLITAVSIVALTVLARVALRRALGDAAAGAARGSTKAMEGIGLFGRVPATPTWAVAVRCLLYWTRDPRYSASLVMVPAMCAVAWFLTSQSGFVVWLLPAGIALLMAFAISADISYDNSAFSLHVLAGVPGLADRLGRVMALFVVSVPLVAVALVVWLVRAGDWGAAPAMLGLCATLLLGGAGVVSVVSARYTYPTPPPGSTPMKSAQGFTLLNLVMQFVLMGVIVLLGLPALALLVVYLISGDHTWSWLALAVGLVEGLALLWIGARAGGRWLDARAPELLQEVSAYR